jgi:Protein of unknown function DUF262/Protein of unknown function (DUF1524)
MMQRQLESKSLSIAELMAPPFLFAAPAFQRAFAWDVDEAERLLSDLQTAVASSHDDIYFIGAVLLMRLPLAGTAPPDMPDVPAFSGPERSFEIIDGLQRIVTLAILIAVLRDLLHRQAPASLMKEQLHQALVASGLRLSRVRLRGSDGTLLDHATSEVGACLVPPLAEIQSDAQERIIAIRDFFVRQLQPLELAELERLATFVLENCSLVGIITNTLDRAYQMFTSLNDAGKPLTRNDILKAELIGALPEGDRARALQAWETLSGRLGKDFEQIFSFISTEGGRGSLPILEAIRSQAAAHPRSVAGFVFETLLPSGDIISSILQSSHTGTAQSAGISRTLRHLNWLPGQEWVPPLLAFWKRHGSDATALSAFVAALDRFAYGARLLSLGNSKRAQRMAAIAAEVTSHAGANGPWASLQFSRDELRNINFGLRDLHGRGQHVCRLVLQRLEEQMSGRDWHVGDAQMTVEHILPLKISPQSIWKKDFPDVDARARLATCLGNLTLVTRSVNEAAANHDYERKYPIYFAESAAPITQLTQELRTTHAWTQTLIEERLELTMQRFSAIWAFDRP